MAILLLLLTIFPMLAVYGSSEERNGAFTNGHACGKKIALTFDDGPHPRYTKKVLEVLKEYDIRATFFFIGENVSYYPESAKAVANAGHEIGNHTYRHPHLKKIGDPELLSEISDTQDVIQKVTGVTPLLFRPPEGNITAGRSKMLADLGLKGVLWSVDTRDWCGISKEKIVKNALENVHGGDVILFHDYVGHPFVTADALREIIPELLKQGFCFVTVSELMAEEVQNSEERSASPSVGESSAPSGQSSGCSS